MDWSERLDRGNWSTDFKKNFSTYRVPAVNSTWADLICASFSGANYIDIGTFFRPTVLQKWVVSAWVNLPPGGGGSILANHDPADPDYVGLDIAIFEANMHFLWNGPVSGNTRIDDADGFTITASTWFHVLFAWDGSAFKWWLNGVAKTTVGSGTILIASYSVNTKIGNGDNWGSLNGKLSDLAIAVGVTSIPSNADATRLYNSGRSFDISGDSVFSTGTKAWYWLGDGGDGSTTIDRIGGLYNGTWSPSSSYVVDGAG